MQSALRNRFRFHFCIQQWTVFSVTEPMAIFIILYIILYDSFSCHAPKGLKGTYSGYGGFCPWPLCIEISTKSLNPFKIVCTVL